MERRTKTSTENYKKKRSKCTLRSRYYQRSVKCNKKKRKNMTNWLWWKEKKSFCLNRFRSSKNTLEGDHPIRFDLDLIFASILFSLLAKTSISYDSRSRILLLSRIVFMFILIKNLNKFFFSIGQIFGFFVWATFRSH